MTELKNEAVNPVNFHDYVRNEYIPYFLSKPRNRIAVSKELLRIEVLLSLTPIDTLLCEMNENSIKVLLNNVATRYWRKYGKNTNLSKSTVNRYRSRLLAIFNHAKRAGIVAYNPVNNIKRGKEVVRNRVLSHGELMMFLESCQKSRNKELHDVMLIAFYTSMRLGEVLNLKISNIALDLDKITIHGSQTKSGIRKEIPIHSALKPTIERRIGKVLSGGGSMESRLFKSTNMRTAQDQAIKRTGLEGFMCRDLRRTCATMLKNSGVHIHTISKILGHSSISMTEKYLATDFETLQTAVSTLKEIET
jgi:integrase